MKNRQRANSHKGQHWIPARAYREAWADPDVLAGRKPFVHVFSRDGLRHRPKAPKNIFKETDLYTIKGPNGERDLGLEHALAKVEGEFAKLRRDYLEHERQLPLEQRVALMAFVA